MNTRVKSAIFTVLIQGALGYALFMGLTMAISERGDDRLTVVDVRPERGPPPKEPPKAAPMLPPNPALIRPDADWATSSVVQRDLAFIATTKWVKENMVSAEERLLDKWRRELPQGSGPGRVTRLQPPNLPTHTLYWPAKWAKGPLPIIAWANGYTGRCSNSSLPYAAFLSEIASHGYFVVAVGNDDIDYPQPEGLEILADGRPLRTQPSALTKAIDWAVAENGRAGSPYAGKLDPSKIAYMGHGCGGQQAMTASVDPRTTTIVALNATTGFRSETAKRAPIAHFEGSRDDGSVRDAGEENFAKAKAAGLPMFKATLDGTNYDSAYPGPDRRWSKAVIAWLNWQLKGDESGAMMINGLSGGGWSRAEATGL